MKRIEAINEKIKRLEADKDKFLAKTDDLTSLEDLEKCVKELDMAKELKRILEIELGIYKIPDPPEFPDVSPIEEEVKPVEVPERINPLHPKPKNQAVTLTKKAEEDNKKAFEKMMDRLKSRL
jgi:hypothetical protein